MNLTTRDFDYHLPADRIAQTPAAPRESAKLMVVNRSQKTLTHKHVSDLPDYFTSGDVVVVNNTKVFHARLKGTTNENKRVELFLVRPQGSNQWMAIGKPGKKLLPGTTVSVADDFVATIAQKHDDGTLTVSFGLPDDEVIARANTYGEIPVPPYIKTLPKDSDYQTSYAKITGSVAAPTAGFHMTEAIRKQLKEKGVTIVEVTLHVGLGTFMPIKTDDIEAHHMHGEWVNVTSQAADTINKVKSERRRVIAVGTTSARTLEGVAALHNGTLQPYTGDVNLFITPGFHFNVIDALLTNFHLPKSTLIVLVSALVGREFILNAYNEAVREHYRFYSFGDAMLIT